MNITADVTSHHEVNDSEVQVTLSEVVPAVLDEDGQIIEPEQRRNTMHINLDRATAAAWIAAGSVEITFGVAQRATARAARK